MPMERVNSCCGNMVNDASGSRGIDILVVRPVIYLRGSESEQKSLIRMCECDLFILEADG